jgi:hypothetical protein
MFPPRTPAEALLGFRSDLRVDPRVRIDIGCVVRRRDRSDQREGIVVDLVFSPHPQARVRWFWDDTSLEPLEALEVVPTRPATSSSC